MCQAWIKNFFLTHCRSFKLCTSWQHSEWWVTILFLDRPPLLLLSIRVLRQRWGAHVAQSADHNWEATRQRSKWRQALAPPSLVQQNRSAFTFYVFFLHFTSVRLKLCFENCTLDRTRFVSISLNRRSPSLCVSCPVCDYLVPCSNRTGQLFRKAFLAN